MSAQKTNSVIVFLAVLVAAAIVVYAMVGRRPSKPQGPETGETPPVLTPPVVDPTPPAEPNVEPEVAHIDQTTDTTNLPEQPAAGQGAEPAPTPNLLDAAERGDLDAMRAMFAQGAEVNQVDAAGRTALMAAAGAGQVDAVFLLLNSGANPAPRDHARKSARDYALSRYDESGKTIARILEDALGPAPVSEPTDK